MKRTRPYQRIRNISFFLSNEWWQSCNRCAFNSPLQAVSSNPKLQTLLSAHYRVEGHPHINPIREVLSTPSRTYLLFPPASTDLHSYVRHRRRLKEPHARLLFQQIVSAVDEAHSKGIVLRDLKLRKFVFTNESR